MADYTFVTRWELEAPIQLVWDAIYDAEAWPSWWRGVVRVDKLAPGDAHGIGSVRRMAWKSALPYTLEFESRTVRVEAPRLLEATVVGELVGTGLWQLTPRDASTVVQYDWNVSTTRAWMNLIAPIARPVFAWNHDYVMRHGGECLARLLGARLVRA